MTEESEMIGKLYKARGKLWTRGCSFNKDDLILVVSLESPADAAVVWRREIRLLCNGTMRNVMFTDFKSLLRSNELEEIQ